MDIYIQSVYKGTIHESVWVKNNKWLRGNERKEKVEKKKTAMPLEPNVTFFQNEVFEM